MCFKNVTRAFDDLHGLLFLQRKNYNSVVPWKKDGILNLLKKLIWYTTTTAMKKKLVSAGNRRDSFIKDIFEKKKNQLEQQKSP